MILIRQLAWRYLKGKRKGNAVPVLSRISMAAIAVAACAMMVLFSVFNGFELLIKDLYKAFYPPIKITAAKGKFFELEATKLQQVQGLREVRFISRVIEDNVWLNANDEDALATLKGIDTMFAHVNSFSSYIYEGDSAVLAAPATAIAGLQLANKLGLDPTNVFSPLMVYYPNANVHHPSLQATDALQTLQLKVTGVFMVQEEFDSKYVLASLPVVQSFFMKEGKYSSLELSLADGVNADVVKEKIQQIVGGGLVVQTRFEQNRTLYIVMQSEKWAVYAILLLVLVIASFNMVGALTLLVMEKQKDIAILKAMGATPVMIRKLFLLEGMLWALVGGVIGLIAGIFLCLGQQQFQWIKLQGAFIIESYPVALQFSDVVLILATIVVVGIAAAWYPAYRATLVKDSRYFTSS